MAIYLEDVQMSCDDLRGLELHALLDRRAAPLEDIENVAEQCDNLNVIIQGRTAMLIAARTNQAEAMKLLHSKGASMNVRLDKFAHTPLYASVLCNCSEAFFTAIELGANLDDRIANTDVRMTSHRADQSILGACVLVNRFEMASVLVERGATFSSDIALDACTMSRPRLLRLFLDKFTSVCATELYRMLIESIRAGSIECVSILLEAGAPHVGGATQFSKAAHVLDFAVRSAPSSVIEYMLDVISVHASQTLVPALMARSNTLSPHLVARIFEMSNVDEHTLGNYLIIAVKSGSVEHCRLLLARGASVTARDADGRSAVNLAFHRDQWSVFVYLIRQGALRGYGTMERRWTIADLPFDFERRQIYLSAIRDYCVELAYLRLLLATRLAYFVFCEQHDYLVALLATHIYTVNNYDVCGLKFELSSHYLLAQKLREESNFRLHLRSRTQCIKSVLDVIGAEKFDFGPFNCCAVLGELKSHFSEVDVTLLSFSRIPPDS